MKIEHIALYVKDLEAARARPATGITKAVSSPLRATGSKSRSDAAGGKSRGGVSGERELPLPHCIPPTGLV